MITLSNSNQIRHNGQDVALMKFNGVIVYEKTIEDRGYCVEYTVDGKNYPAPLTDYIERFLPRIYTTITSYDYTGYESIELTLLDGTVTTDISTKCNNIAKITLWYPESTKEICFDSGSYSHNIITIDYCKTDNFTTLASMFNGCEKLTKIKLSGFKTSNASGMSYMFNGCNALTTLDLRSFKTNNVYSMASMFNGCNSLTSLKLSSFNTSKVTNMSSMFSDCSSLSRLDLSNFDTGNVTNMRAMFLNCGHTWGYDFFELTGLSNWNTSKVINMSRMFAYSDIVFLDLSKWNTSKVTNMGYMFEDCDTLLELDISGFDTSGVTSIDYMFMGCYNLCTIRMDNCDSFTISKIINSSGFPTNAIEGVTRTIYCKETEAAYLTEPDNWVFSYID